MAKLYTDPVKCPKCGGTKVDFTERATIYRSVWGIKDGVLQIDGAVGYTEEDDTAKLYCIGCNHRWDVPDDLELDFN